jgi:hypothetical protein
MCYEKRENCGRAQGGKTCGGARKARRADAEP